MQKMTSIRGAFVLLLGLTLVSCAFQQAGGASGKDELSYAGFVKRLEQTGTTFTKVSPMNADLLLGTPHGLSIATERITVFEYVSGTAAQEDASRVSPQGDTIHTGPGSAMVADWVATPHFYRNGRIIVFYVGNQQKITALLQSLLGKQFAGGNV